MLVQNWFEIIWPNYSLVRLLDELVLLRIMIYKYMNKPEIVYK